MVIGKLLCGGAFFSNLKGGIFWAPSLFYKIIHQIDFNSGIKVGITHLIKTINDFRLFFVVMILISLLKSDLVFSKELVTISGKAIHAISRLPMRNFPVVAETSISNQKDNKYRMRRSKTDSKGFFKITNILPNYGYVVSIQAEGFESESAYAIAQNGERNVTLEKPLKVCSIPVGNGIFVWNRNGWKHLKANTSLKVSTQTVWGRLNMRSRSYLFYHYPTAIGTPRTFRSQVNGISSKIVSIDNTYLLKSPIILAVRGPQFLSYRIMPLYFIPNISLTACPENPKECGSIEFQEGYYLGLRNLFAKTGQKSLLLSLNRGPINYTDFGMEIDGTPLYELCKQKVAGFNKFVYGYINLRGANLFSIVPRTVFGPKSIYMSVEGKLIQKKMEPKFVSLLSNGLDAITVAPNLIHQIRDEEENDISFRTKCNENKWNMRLGIYYKLLRPAIIFDMDLLYSGIEGNIDKNKYYSNLLSLSNGLLLVNSLDKTQTGSELISASLSSLGLASKIYEIDDYFPIIMSSLSTSIKAMANPTPESISLYVVSSTLSSMNNLISSIKINKKRKKFETLMGVRDILDAYYLHCGDISYIKKYLNLSINTNNCDTDLLTCLTSNYLRNLGFESDPEKLTPVINSTVSHVNTIYRNLKN